MPLAGVAKTAKLVNRFTRITCCGFTCLPLVVGASSVRSDPPLPELIRLLCLGISLHLFAYIMNDLCDLSIDRANPRRSQDPLVTGEMSLRFARGTVIAQLAIVIACLGWNMVSIKVYGGAAIMLITISLYNCYGKRLSIPCAADILVGLAGAAAVLTGAWMVADQLSLATWCFAAAQFLFLTLINMLHGGLRDLGNDRFLGAKTSMLIMGAKVTDTGYQLPAAAVTVSLALQSLITVTAIAASEAFSFARIPGQKGGMTPYCAFAMILSWIALCQAARWRHTQSDSTRAGLIHLLVTYVGVNLPVFYHLSNTVRIVAAATFVLPLLCGSWWADIRSGLPHGERARPA